MKLVSRVLLIGLFLNLATHAHAEVAIVMSAKSTIGVLTKQQVSDLFLGKVAAFPDGSLAVPLEQNDKSPEREDFHSKVTKRSSSQLKAYWAKQMFSGTGNPPKEVSGDADVKKLISANPNMIGYIEKASVDSSVKVVLTP